jgi:L-ornithine N5-oxygenase
LIIRGAALKPSDDSPFVNEIFDPERVDDVWSQDPAIRAEAIARDKATNYGVVRIELLEEIYTAMYTQKILYDSEEDWPQRIRNHRTIASVDELPGSSKSALRLNLRNETGTFCAAKRATEETLDVDLVVVASGYVRNAHEEMLKNVRHLMPGGGQNLEQRWGVGRNYRVETAPGAVAEDAGLWLQGCNEKTHGLSDSLLSILAVRGGEMVDSIFGSECQA